MSKDLKNEYEALLESDIPDLWSRIEPRLHEKHVETQNVIQTKIHDEHIMPSDVSQYQKNQKKQGVTKKIYFYSGIVAACLCLAIAIPAIVRFADSGAKFEESKDMAMNAATMDSAVMDSAALDSTAMDSAAAPDSVIETEDWAPQENTGAAGDFDVMEESTSEIEDAASDGISDYVANDMAEDAAASEEQRSEESASEESVQVPETEMLEVRGEVLGIVVNDNHMNTDRIVYEIALRMDDADKPEVVKETERIQVVQYRDENGELQAVFSQGMVVSMKIWYDAETDFYILDIGTSNTFP